MGAARPLLLLFFSLLALAFASLASPSAAEICALAPTKTLTLDCAGRCASGSACLAFDAFALSPCDLEDVSSKSACSANATLGCTFQCFAPYVAAADTFKFFIAFNWTRATRAPVAADSSASTSDAAALESLTDDVPYESNAFVRRIGELALPASITTAVISGGRSDFLSTERAVVDVEIDPKVFFRAPQLRSVSLLNMDLGTRVADVAALMPASISFLSLRNTKLTQVPPSIDTLTQLRTLSLDENELAEFSLLSKLSKLKTLQLSKNKITSFTGNDVSSLELLDLSDNKLEAFPYSVLHLRSLHTLRLQNNPTMSKVLFSTFQFGNLSKLDKFSIDSAVVDNSSCSTSQRQTIPRVGYTVCVLSEDEWTAFQSRSNNRNSSRSQSKTLIIIVILLAVVVAIGISACIYSVCKKRQQRQRIPNKSTTRSGVTDTAIGDNADFEQMDDAEGSVSNAAASGGEEGVELARIASSEPTSSQRYTLWTDAELLARRVQSDYVEDIRVIGNGGFAIVWLVHLHPLGRFCASKRLIQYQITRQKTLEFVAEIKLSMQLTHPSIVQVVGVAWTIETDLQVLLEYMPRGDLKSFLGETNASDAPWGFDKLRLAIDIIEALVYVHSFSPPLVHRDLKSRNVLLADDMTAKLCDFGVSRFASENGTMTTGVGTGKWLAPEVVAGSKDYDTSCDIYAFGVILTELDTHRLPYEDLKGAQGNMLSEVAVLQMVASGRIVPSLSESCPEEICQLATQCLSFEPAHRPSAIGVAYALRRLRNHWSKTKTLFRTPRA